MDILKDLKKFIKTHKKPVIAIIGATATGKTDVSLKIAKEIGGEIISTDSRQIYKEMDIATDVLPLKDRKGVPHHLLAEFSPDHVISMSEYREIAEGIIKDIYKRKRVPMLVGGTFLYISAILEGYKMDKIPPDEKLRKKLYDLAKKKGNEAVYEKLVKLDPKAAKKIHMNNLRYVIRAIEINMAGKKKVDKKARKSPYDTYMIGLTRPRAEIYERINKRVDAQVERGLIKEVEKLLKKGYDLSLPSMTSLGVKEIIPYIKKKMSLEECLEILKMNTRRYAKRQTTWLKRYKSVKWLKNL
jgi:tRNA dimethylallyltransferase